MPVYEYECDVCGMRFDLQRHFDDPHPTACPVGHKGVHRVFAPPSIIFKGSGFYVTDHGRNGQVSRRHSESVASSKSERDGAEAKAGGQA